MYAFNAFQSVVFYALSPFAMLWLSKQDFPYQDAAVIAAGITYLVYTIFLASAVTTGFETWGGTNKR